MTDHVPPHDLEAEIAVLGAMLLVNDPAEAKAIMDIVAPGDFYRTQHAQVFASQIDLWETKFACDVLLLRNDLQEAGQLEAIGGTAAIGRIAASVPLTANAPHYARIVRKRKLEREVLAASALHEEAQRENGNGLAGEAFLRLTRARIELDDFQHPIETAKPSSWDLAAMATEGDDPPPDEFVSRLFVRPSSNIVYGPPQAGKSWAIMALCLDAVMGGGNFLGCEEFYIKPLREIRDGRTERVLWVFGSEDTRSRVKRRLKTLIESGPHAGKTVPSGAFVVATPPGGMSIHLPQGWRWLQKKIAEVNPTIVVLDTIASLTGNSLDVNKAEQVIPFISQLNALRSEKNLILISLHHTRKGSTDGKKSAGSQADAMLGAGAWRALSEGILSLDAPDGDTSKVTVLSVKAKDIERPIPKLFVTLESPGGRFRQLEEDEAPAPREEVRKAGRKPAVTVDQILTLRDRFPDGLPWRQIPDEIGVVRGTWNNHSARLQDELLKLDHVVIGGLMKWNRA